MKRFASSGGKPRKLSVFCSIFAVVLTPRTCSVGLLLKTFEAIFQVVLVSKFVDILRYDASNLNVNNHE